MTMLHTFLILKVKLSPPLSLFLISMLVDHPYELKVKHLCMLIKLRYVNNTGAGIGVCV